MVSAQAERAVATADLVLFVVDGRTGATETDLTVARTLRRGKRPVRPGRDQGRRRARRVRRRRAVVARARASRYPVSGLHGRGSGDLLDAVLAALPDAPRRRATPEAGPAASP